jgi:hypothetical protein
MSFAVSGHFSLIATNRPHPVNIRIAVCPWHGRLGHIMNKKHKKSNSIALPSARGMAVSAISANCRRDAYTTTHTTTMI